MINAAHTPIDKCDLTTVGIEYIREDFATLEIAEHFFSKDEAEALKLLPADQRATGFFNCWSRKEAFIKAKWMGVSYPLDRFTTMSAKWRGGRCMN